MTTPGAKSAKGSSPPPRPNISYSQARRTISTFSCDIARAVSRRLRSRRERLAPTAPWLRAPRLAPRAQVDTSAYRPLVSALISNPSAASAAERERLLGVSVLLRQPCGFEGLFRFSINPLRGMARAESGFQQGGLHMKRLAASLALAAALTLLPAQ